MENQFNKAEAKSLTKSGGLAEAASEIWSGASKLDFEHKGGKMQLDSLKDKDMLYFGDIYKKKMVDDAADGGKKPMLDGGKKPVLDGGIKKPEAPAEGNIKKPETPADGGAKKPETAADGGTKNNTNQNDNSIKKGETLDGGKKLPDDLLIKPAPEGKLSDDLVYAPDKVAVDGGSKLDFNPDKIPAEGGDKLQFDPDKKVTIDGGKKAEDSES